MKVKVNLNDGVQFIFNRIGGREFQEVLYNFLGTHEYFMQFYKNEITAIQIEKDVEWSEMSESSSQSSSSKSSSSTSSIKAWAK